MDIQQPSLYNLGMGGGNASMPTARFLQDVYRAVKTPNCAVSKDSNQACANNTWTNILFPVVDHNNLNLWDTVNNRVAPMGVPGMYFMDATLNFYIAATPPTANSRVILAWWTPYTVRATCIYMFPSSAADFGSHQWNMNVSCLDFLNGERGTSKADDYRGLAVWHDTGLTIYAAGTNAGDVFRPQVQAFKIPY